MEGEESTGSTQERGSALKCLISFFTIWHMDIGQKDMDEMERNFHLVPLVGLLFGIVLLVEIAILCELGDNLGINSLFIGVAALATVWIGSRFLHFDGLTDFGDGMIVSGTREDHIRALKDTLVGAGGIGVALTVVLFSVATYSTASFYLIALAPMTEVLVKNAMVFAAAFGEPGNGMAARQVSMTTRDSAIRSLVLSAVLTIILGLVGGFVVWMMFDLFNPEYMAYIIVAIVGLIVSALVGIAMARVSNKTFGMVNGDILGATNEIARSVVMFVMFSLFFLMVW